MSDKSLATAPKDLRGMLALPTVKGRFESILGKKSQAFISSIISVSQSNKALQECEPGSIIASAALAASLDLPIVGSLGQSCIVPYSGKAQFQIMSRGFVQLALRSGQYKTMNAAEVHEGEIISRNRLTGEIEFNPEGKSSDKVVGFLFYFKLMNGFEKYTYMTVEECQAHGKKYSRSYDQANGKWKTDFAAMALKTVVKQGLSKWGPLSTEMQRAIEFDQAAVDEDGKPEYIDSTAESVAAIEPIAGPTESASTAEIVTPAKTTPVATDPIIIKPGPVSKKGPEFIIPDESEPRMKYYTLDEKTAQYAKSQNKADHAMRILYDFKDGKRVISSYDATYTGGPAASTF